MEAGAYDYQATLTIDNPGFVGEEVGANPGYLPWTSGTSSGSHTARYYYSDSNAQNADGTWGNMANSSQVFLTVTDSWTATSNEDNEVIIDITTTIDSITRGNIQGNPNLSASYARDIQVKRYAGGVILWQVQNDPINVSKTLASNIQLGTERIVLAPGASTARSSIYLLNHTAGVSWDTPGSTDEMHAGVSFRNNLPADYRPGATWNGFTWVSHNRSGGVCDGWAGSSWRTQRTQDYPTGQGNPPLLYRNGAWYNMKKF